MSQQDNLRVCHSAVLALFQRVSSAVLCLHLAYVESGNEVDVISEFQISQILLS